MSSLPLISSSLLPFRQLGPAASLTARWAPHVRFVFHLRCLPRSSPRPPAPPRPRAPAARPRTPPGSPAAKAIRTASGQGHPPRRRSSVLPSLPRKGGGAAGRRAVEAAVRGDEAARDREEQAAASGGGAGGTRPGEAGHPLLSPPRQLRRYLCSWPSSPQQSSRPWASSPPWLRIRRERGVAPLPCFTFAGERVGLLPPPTSRGHLSLSVRPPLSPRTAAFSSAGRLDPPGRRAAEPPPSAGDPRPRAGRSTAMAWSITRTPRRYSPCTTRGSRPAVGRGQAPRGGAAVSASAAGSAGGSRAGLFVRMDQPEVEDKSDVWGPPGSERSCGTLLSEREKRGGDQGQRGHFAWLADSASPCQAVESCHVSQNGKNVRTGATGVLNM
ncbi:translation initiation factor IF-2-like [Panicum virgatum]|uniref:translation initiation factor IF-2-like n=1 Tax=Panicum virgatum TaxID=38727 RepID=UPI0019D5B7D6|nr:translation initiation factor IF-2-like [Panicum virgatum]